jgi:hypothetical protein
MACLCSYGWGLSLPGVGGHDRVLCIIYVSRGLSMVGTRIRVGSLREEN